MSNSSIKSKITKIINSILNVLIGIFSFVLFLILLLNFQTVFLGQKYNSFFGFSFFEVETGSMEPTIQIGDWIITKQEVNYDLDDIVTYEEEDAFVTHRIIQVYEDTYVTQGDSNNTVDDSIKRDSVVGKVVLIIPRVGIIKKVLLNPKFIIGFIVLLLILCTLIDDNKKSIMKELLTKVGLGGLIKENPKNLELQNEENIKLNKAPSTVPIKTTPYVENGSGGTEEDEDMEFAKTVFSTMKKQDLEDSKTMTLSTIDVNLDIPELNDNKEQTTSQKPKKVVKKVVRKVVKKEKKQDEII